MGLLSEEKIKLGLRQKPETTLPEPLAADVLKSTPVRAAKVAPTVTPRIPTPEETVASLQASQVGLKKQADEDRQMERELRQMDMEYRRAQIDQMQRRSERRPRTDARAPQAVNSYVPGTGLDQLAKWNGPMKGRVEPVVPGTDGATMTAGGTPVANGRVMQARAEIASKIAQNKAMRNPVMPGSVRQMPVGAPSYLGDGRDRTKEFQAGGKYSSQIAPKIPVAGASNPPVATPGPVAETPTVPTPTQQSGIQKTLASASNGYTPGATSLSTPVPVAPMIPSINLDVGNLGFTPNGVAPGAGMYDSQGASRSIPKEFQPSMTTNPRVDTNGNPAAQPKVDTNGVPAPFSAQSVTPRTPVQTAVISPTQPKLTNAGKKVANTLNPMVPKGNGLITNPRKRRV